MGEGQLGDAFGGGDQLSGLGSGSTFMRLGDLDPQGGVLDRQIEGEEGAEGVFIGGGDVEGALQGFFDDRAFDFDRADLGGFRAARTGSRVRRFPCEVRFGAGRKAFGQRRVGGHPLGQGDDGFFEIRCRRGAFFGALQPFVLEVQAEIEARARGRGLGGGLGFDRGAEGEFGAADHPLGVGGFGAVVGFGKALDPGAGVLPGVGFISGPQRALAGAGRVRKGRG